MDTSFERMDATLWQPRGEGQATTQTAEIPMDPEVLTEIYAEDESALAPEEIEAVMASFTACET
jgi:hypothetical protein